MRLAPEGMREILLATVALGLCAVAGWIWFPPLIVIAVIIWAWAISFFRDPGRPCEQRHDRLYAPADGTVTDVARLDSYDGFDGHVTRIGIFLSIFNVHVNRSPCRGRIVKTHYQPGRFLDARHPDCSTQNEAMTLTLERNAEPAGPIVVRQIAGKIARRIICHSRVGDAVEAGERFGLIKFGSRTELIFSSDDFRPTVEKGAKVKAGLTLLAEATSAKPDSDSTGSST